MNLLWSHEFHEVNVAHANRVGMGSGAENDFVVFRKRLI
jgi:hypothetical protein